MSRPVRIGVIGCGEIAQIAHLPLLAALPEFELVGVCDVSASLVDAVGERFGVTQRSTNPVELASRGGLDALLVATMEHVTPALAGCEAGLHLLVEKPLALTPADATAIVDAADAAGVVLMVGYMRQHDPLYQRMLEMVGQDVVGAVTLRDTAGDLTTHARVHEPLKRSEHESGRSVRRAALDATLAKVAGTAAVSRVEAMLMLASHDVAMLRGVLGPPREIALSVPLGDEGLLAVIEYAHCVHAVLEADLGAPIGRWDQQLAVRTRQKRLRLELANPYLSQAPTRLTEATGDGDGTETAVVAEVAPDYFRRQLRHFAAAITSGAPPVGTGADAADDVRLLADLVRAAEPAA